MRLSQYLFIADLDSRGIVLLLLECTMKTPASWPQIARNQTIHTLLAVQFYLNRGIPQLISGKTCGGEGGSPDDSDSAPHARCGRHHKCQHFLQKWPHCIQKWPCCVDAVLVRVGEAINGGKTCSESEVEAAELN